jgi:hypothetical protein
MTGLTRRATRVFTSEDQMLKARNGAITAAIIIGLLAVCAPTAGAAACGAFGTPCDLRPPEIVPLNFAYTEAFSPCIGAAYVKWTPAGTGTDQWYGHVHGDMDCTFPGGATISQSCSWSLFDQNNPTGGEILGSGASGANCTPIDKDFGPASGGHTFRFVFVTSLAISSPGSWLLPTFFCNGNFTPAGVGCRSTNIVSAGIDESDNFA